MAQELARREQVAPERHAVLDGPRIVAVLREALARHDLERSPLRQLFGELRADYGAVVVLGLWRAVAPDPLVPAALARLQNLPRLTPLVDDREELLAHPSGLGLRLDLVAVDHPAAVAIGTVAVAAGHRAGKLLFGRGDDLERADAAGGSRTGGAVGPQPDAGPVRGEPPVRRQRHEAVAVRAGDRVRPDVAFDTDVFRFSREDLLVLRFRPANELARYVFEMHKQTRAVSLWPFNRRLEDQSGNRIQVVGDRRVAQPMNFDWNTAATRGRIQNRQRFQGTPGNGLDPITITVGWRVRKRAFVAVGIGTEILLASLGRVKPAPCRHRIPVNPEHVQELLSVSVRW